MFVLSVCLPAEGSGSDGRRRQSDEVRVSHQRRDQRETGKTGEEEEECASGREGGIKVTAQCLPD